jgi:hypothetical protein
MRSAGPGHQRREEHDVAKSRAQVAAQVTELVRPILQPGEELLGIVRLDYNGTVPPNVTQIDAGILVLDEAEHRPPPDPDRTVAFPVAKQVAVALTGDRLFVWSLGLTGKPNRFVGEVPLRAVAAARGGTSGSGEATLQVTMRSGAIVDFEYLRGEPAEAFTEQLVALVSS